MKKEEKQTTTLLTESEINTLAGAASGVLVSILVSPLDVIKAHMQVKRLEKGVPSKPLLVIIYRIAQREGLRAFFKGLGTTMLGYVPNWALYFSMYQWSKKTLHKNLVNTRFHQDMYINLLASIAAGATSNIVFAPVWTIRARMMTQSNLEFYRNSFHAAKKIYQTEGIHALYRGLAPSMLGLIHVAIQFPLYEYLKKKCAGDEPSNSHLSTGQLIFASGVSKLVASVVAYPHEVVRIRLQYTSYNRPAQESSSNSTSKLRYRDVRHAVMTIAEEEGIRGFYRGIKPAILRAIPAAVLTLSSYEKLKDFLSDNFGEASLHR